MARADALDQVSLSTRVLMQGDRLEANDFNMKLDDSKLTGWLQLASIADASDCNGDPTCVTAAKAFAAMAAMTSGGSARIEQQRVQHHPAWGVLAAVLPSAVQVAGSVYQSQHSRDIAIAQYDFLGGAIGALSGSAALQPPAAPNITVGGDFIPGNQHHGDTVGGNWTGRDAVGRDNIGRDQRTGDDTRTNWGAGNRFASPGPIDDNSGDRCTGDSCQPVNTPPPLPAPPDGSGGD